MKSFSIAPPGGGSRSRKPNDPLLGHCDSGTVAVGVRFHHWRLGFRQSSFRPITRVLQDHVFSAFRHFLLLGHALFPSGFRLQVNPMTQKRPSEFLLTESGIQHDVPRRTLSTHTAQALNNASAGYDRVRLRRPTTPLTRRGLPIGLGVNLDSTTAEPVTEFRRRPHPRTSPPGTVLLCLPNRLAVGSHPPTPGGSGLAFARGDVSTPIRPATGRRSLPPPSSTRRPIDSPCGGPTLAGGRRASHVASRESSWVRPRLDAGGTTSAPDELAASGPGHVPFWSKPVSTFGLSFVTTLAAVHLGWPYHAPLVPDRPDAGSRNLGSRPDHHPCG